MARTVHFVPGAKWYAGVDLPFYVAQSVVTSGAQDLGFRQIVWHDRAETPPINPTTDPRYSDAWDEWAEGVYEGPERDHTLPWTIPWLAFVNPQAPVAASVPVQVPDLSTQDKAFGIARVALASADPASMRAAAAMLSAQGFFELASELERQAARPEQPDQEAPETEPSTGGIGVAKLAAGAILLDVVGIVVFGWIVRAIGKRRS